MTALDPITLQVVGHAFGSISDEMNLALVRTAYSTNIKDRRDCSAAIFTIDGQLIAQSAFGTPLHLGVLPHAVRNLLAEIPIASMRPGDDYICNLPYPSGPGHLNDITIVSPVFVGDRLAAVVGCSAHHVDVGGGAPGSMPFGVTEIFQEGLQIPPLAISQGGRINEDLVSLILQNVRTQREFRGDLMAQIAANNVGELRAQELIAERGSDVMAVYVPGLLDYSEQRMRAALARLPQGEWEFKDYLEGDGITDTKIAIHARVTLVEGELHVDFTGTDDQVPGPLNCRPPSAIACVYYVALSLAGGNMRANDGLFRPIKVTTRPGSLLEARYPAAVCNSNIITTQRIVDVVLGAVSQGAPDHVCAACSGTMNLFNIGGRDPRTGELFNYVETYGGGQGALPYGDGGSAIHTHMTNTRNASVEQIEIAYPIVVERYSLIDDSEGSGEFRGGFGLERELRILGEASTLTLGSDRHKSGPWGLGGGGDGHPGECLAVYPDGTSERLPSKLTRAIPTGTRIISRTPGGGGRGDALVRSVERVARDVNNGHISLSRARTVYGVVFVRETNDVDVEATRALRHDLLSQGKVAAAGGEASDGGAGGEEKGLSLSLEHE